MTRKHFKALAAALSLTRASLATCEAIAVACEASNPRFDRRRFILACATKSETTDEEQDAKFLRKHGDVS